MVTFWGESHGSTIASTSSRLLIKGPAAVPRQSHQDRAIRSIIIIVLFLESRSYLVVHLLVVLELRGEEARCFTGRSREKGAIALGVEVVS